jgi:hypothetical protein
MILPILGKLLLGFGFYTWIALKFTFYTAPVKIYRVWRPAHVDHVEKKKEPVQVVIESTDEAIINQVLETIPTTQVIYDKKTGDVTISEQVYILYF